MEEKPKRTSPFSLKSFFENNQMIYAHISFGKFFGWSHSAARETEECLLAKYGPTLNKIGVMLLSNASETYVTVVLCNKQP